MGGYYVIMAYIVVAYIVMAYIVMAYIVMAPPMGGYLREAVEAPDRHRRGHNYIGP